MLKSYISLESKIAKKNRKEKERQKKDFAYKVREQINNNNLEKRFQKAFRKGKKCIYI